MSFEPVVLFFLLGVAAGLLLEIPALVIGASLGVTFPFNLFVGIPLYYWMVQTAHRIVGGGS